MSKDVAERCSKYNPDIVVCGHSHRYLFTKDGDMWVINPGSAGPARFKLGRSVALLSLPDNTENAVPTVKQHELPRAIKNAHRFPAQVKEPHLARKKRKTLETM